MITKRYVISLQWSYSKIMATVSPLSTEKLENVAIYFKIESNIIISSLQKYSFMEDRYLTAFFFTERLYLKLSKTKTSSYMDRLLEL